MRDRNDAWGNIEDTEITFYLDIVNTFREESEPVCDVQEWRKGKSDGLIDV